MSDPAETKVPAAPAAADAKPAAKPQGKLTRIAYGIGSVVFILIGLVRIYNFFFPSLPGCDGSVARETLSKILKTDNLEPSSYEEMKTLTSSKDELTCNANAKMADGSLVALAYRIFWKDKDSYVEITQKAYNKDQK